jgi:hypothetical protein
MQDPDGSEPQFIVTITNVGKSVHSVADIREELRAVSDTGAYVPHLGALVRIEVDHGLRNINKCDLCNGRAYQRTQPGNHVIIEHHPSLRAIVPQGLNDIDVAISTLDVHGLGSRGAASKKGATFNDTVIGNNRIDPLRPGWRRRLGLASLKSRGFFPQNTTLKRGGQALIARLNGTLAIPFALWKGARAFSDSRWQRALV